VVDADGAMDRAAMRQLMMTDPRAKRQLEAILHPMIAVDIGRRRQQALEQHCPVLILDIPLLAESAERWRPQLDAVWVVDCEADVQVERVIKRSGWPAEQVRAVIALQATRRQRLAIADAVIHNSGAGLAELLRAVDALWSSLQ
jgi:dephospho-CoA kinase